MTKQLAKITEVYRVETEQEAGAAMDHETEIAKERGYKVVKLEKKYKTKKQKGEIIEDWYLITVEKSFEE